MDHHNASSPLDASVLEAMLPYLGKLYGNPQACTGWAG